MNMVFAKHTNEIVLLLNKHKQRWSNQSVSTLKTPLEKDY